MRNILARANHEVLQQFAWSKVLLAFDYDGTLAPIVSKPDRAIMRRTTRRLLEELVKLYPCMVISGRAQRDATRRLHGIGVHKIVGNHGAEPWQGTSRPGNKSDRWRRLLGERLSGLQGVKIEDKGYTIAIHYRQSREKKLARSAILEAVSALGEVRLIGGNQVVNILPHDAPHKGIALERERAFLKCDTAIYVGDDETDEDVFALDQPGQLLTIRVGQRRSSAAAYFIESQRRIDDLLRILLRLRQETDIAQPAWGGR
ncbi:MAG TPA: trehalose-phosphatase [Acidobacteriota bacterium]|nr:trehalose-phosphatase [Acidobacteriota bacterium]